MRTAILQVALFVCLCVGEGEICEHVGELVCVCGGGGGGVEARQVMERIEQGISTVPTVGKVT